MLRQSLGRRLSSLKVGQKIGLGYALALSIAVSGSVAGFGIGHYYKQRTEAQEKYAWNEVELLQRLQSQVLQTRTHQQQLIPLSQYPEDFQHEYTHLLKHKAEIQETWAYIKTFVAEAPISQNEVHQREIPAFLQTYKDVPERYTKEVDARVQQIQKLNLTSSADVKKAQALMLEFTNSSLALQFDGISDDLVGILDQSYQELEVAVRANERASVVAENIVIASIGLSVAIAALLAIATSRAIAQPIQVLTSIAQRSTKESNFDLKATVEQDDEIGLLADAFNQLIHSVNQLLHQQKEANEQLEVYSQTLEFKVEERTQELNDKNNQLQRLLEELQRTQVQMVQSEKMSALGQMVAGVAHEINNPVNFIHGNLAYVQEYARNLLDFVQLHQKHYPDPDPDIQAEAEALDIGFIQADLPKMLDSMRMGTERIRQIVLSLRNFSRSDEAGCKAVDIHEGIDSTLLILQHRLKSQPERPAIQVVRDYDDLPPVECYPGQLNQAFMNILANAIDALEEFATHQSPESQKKPEITIRTSKVDANWVKIVISDNGMGMPEHIHRRIFDPFFTTKAVGKGTGMGMPISYQILTEKHGGTLSCFSILGEGTEFTIQIPVQQKVHVLA
ncbi:MAG TPA: ATP-binding protein [Leptolyngbyaceae cyanobacterium]